MIRFKFWHLLADHDSKVVYSYLGRTTESGQTPQAENCPYITVIEAVKVNNNNNNILWFLLHT